jgi:hypothetical protein
MLVRAADVLPALLLGACTGAPEPAGDAAPEVPRALLPFAAACAFLPVGFHSLSFDRFDAGSAPGSRPCLRARVGSDFQQPQGIGVGAFRGVEVLDFGGDGLPSEESLELVPPTHRSSTEGITGVAVRHRPAEDYPCVMERWVARLDDRFVVTASDRALMARALLRSGRLDELLRPFAALRELPDDVVDVVCALPRPGDRSYWGRPIPIEPTVAWVQPAPLRLVFHHRQPLPPYYLPLPEQLPNAKPASSRRGEWIVTSYSLADDPMAGRLAVELLFGLAIAI